MKKIFYIACLLASQITFGQRVQGTIKPGPSGNEVVLSIRPTAPFVAQMSALNLAVQIPTSIGARPTVTFTNLQPGLYGAWTQLDDDQGDGYYTWGFNCAVPGGSNTAATNWPATELDVLRITFGGVATPVQVRSCHYLDGGLTGFALFYVETNLALINNGVLSDWGNLFYGTGASNGTTAPGNIGVPNANYSFVPLSLFTLPVTFNSFDARCHEKGAMITWATASEQNSKNFEIQRSEDGTNWRAIGTVQAAGNSSNVRNYNYLDLEGGVAMYRIRQTDLDGRSTLTAVKRTDCQSSDFNVVLYPVPTRDNLTVVIRSDKDIKTDLQIIDMKGSIIRRIPTQINKGNNTINLVVAELPAGQYMLRSADAAGIVNKKFTVAR